MNTGHIVTSFDRELGEIHTLIMRMAGLAENQFAQALDALSRRDSELGQKVAQNDSQIDDLERELDQEVVRLVALRQPMADDLRATISALKIASDLERIGDYAKNIAKRAVELSKQDDTVSFDAVVRLGKFVRTVFKDTVDAFATRDVDRSVDIWHRDAEVDEMYIALFREILSFMGDDSKNVTTCTHLMFIAKNIERIGDHATNIAEAVYYLETGEQIEGRRPKGNTTAFDV